jgi:hypothetical protein
MRRACLLALLVLCHAPPEPSPAQGRPVTAQDKKVDQAIERALVFLKNHQQADGTWHGGRRGGGSDPAVTALAVMAFLSAGHLPGEGPYGAAVEKGVRAVLGFQHANGLIASKNRGQFELYQHGICTLMLAEAAGMTEDRQLAREIRGRLVRAVGLILQAQRKPGPSPHRGGWRYRVRGTDSDLSVTGWQLLALRAAKNLGCDVPGQNIEQAVDYVKRCQEPGSGGFRYMTGRAVTVPCTGTGILALEVCGKNWHRSRASSRAADYLLRHRLPWNAAHFSYGVYYCSQAMFQLGGNHWEAYKPYLHKVLLDNQQPSNGCWHCGENVGPNYSTAMAVLALTVEYRYLPIYQRDESREKAD